MTTEKKELSESSIVQTQRIDDAKFIVELLSDGIYSHLQYWSAQPSKMDYSRTDFLHAYSESEERYLIFQRQFLHYLVISPWKLDQVKEQLEKIKKDSMFNAFISIQVHREELEYVRPGVGFLGLDFEMGGMYDRLVRASLLYAELYTESLFGCDPLDFPISPLDEQYLSLKPKGIKGADINIIETFALACIDGFEVVLAEREWARIDLGGCYSRGDMWEVKGEVEGHKEKLLPILTSQLKQVFCEYTNQKKARSIFRLIGSNFLKHKKNHGENATFNDNPEAACNDPHAEFIRLVSSSLTFHDVHRSLSFDPKSRSISFPHIVGRILRVSSWYAQISTSNNQKLDDEELGYLNKLALADG